VEPADIEMAERIISQIRAWVSDVKAAGDLVLPIVQNRVVRRYVESTLNDLSVSFTQRGKNWMVSRLTQSKEAQDLQAQELARDQRIEFVGFRDIFQMVIASRKPIVGHNVLADFMFLISSMDGPIPKDIPNFKGYMQRSFPEVWDTKILSTCTDEIESKFETTGLQTIFETYLKADGNKLGGISFPLGFERYCEVLRKKAQGKPSYGALAHEAAYDALCTGYVFLHLRQGLSQIQFQSCKNVLAVFKNLHGINLGLGTPDGRWLPRGPVLGLAFSNKALTDVEVLASLAPIKGRVTWVEDGTAVALLMPGENAETALAHYRNNSLGITAFLVTSEQ
jgi:hypothetical protein